MGKRVKSNHRCELEIVFVNHRQGISAANTDNIWFNYHQGFFNWCDGKYDIIRSGHPSKTKFRDQADDGHENTTFAAKRLEKYPEPWFYTRSGDPAGNKSSLGQPYLCPNTCWMLRNNATHIGGVDVRGRPPRHVECPFF